MNMENKRKRKKREKGNERQEGSWVRNNLEKSAVADKKFDRWGTDADRTV